jgi:hypothetical protein
VGEILIPNNIDVGPALTSILTGSDIQPGSPASYELCKQIYLYHPIGARVAENPVSIAQSQSRIIKVRAAPSDAVANRFISVWSELKCDEAIKRTKTLSRVYGISTLALMAKGVPSSRPIDYKELPNLKIDFNVWDPLNTAGSLTMEQDPNSIRFQKPIDDTVSVQGSNYHPSRTVVTLNGPPIYIAWTTSAFGYVGRSSYQRALFPLKSYIATMRTNAMVARKAGVLIAMMKMPGSIVNNIMAALAGQKRVYLKESATDDVISISNEEKVESLNLQNLEGPATMARTNILEDIAFGSDTPVRIINALPFAGGFSEGKEDSKAIAKYIDGFRDEMNPLYEFMDRIVMYRAWTPEFFETIKKKFPEEYKGKTHLQAFYEWSNSFTAMWPSFLVEPESEKIKVKDTKLKSIIAWVQVLAPMIDPKNRAELIEWGNIAMTEDAEMFSSAPNFDYDVLEEYEPPEPMAIVSGKQGVEGKPGEGKPAGNKPTTEKGPQGKPGRAKIKLSTADSVVPINIQEYLKERL